MTEPRPILELLLIVQENFDQLFCTGLCKLFQEMADLDLITCDERYILKDYLHNNKPRIRGEEIDTPNFPYYWKMGRTAYREKWLTKQIEKLKT